MSEDGRFNTHSPSRAMLAAVCEELPRPSTALPLSHQAEDIGAMLGVPSSLRVVIRTTGVPKYRTLIPGTVCMPPCSAPRAPGTGGVRDPPPAAGSHPRDAATAPPSA